MSPSFAEKICRRVVVFATETAAEVLNRNNSSYEQQIPNLWNCSIMLLRRNITPSAIWRLVGLFVTMFVTTLATNIDFISHEGLLLRLRISVKQVWLPAASALNLSILVL